LREEDVSSGTIDDLLLLKRRKIVLSETAYGHAHAHQLMLGQLGLDIDGIFDVAHVSAVDGLTAMKRGDASAFGMTARPPTVVVGQAFSTTSPSLKFLDITEKQRQKINGAHWLWMPYVIPASTYPGQDSDVNTIALANQLIVKAEVDANVVHAITKSLFEHLDYLGRVDSLMADLELSDALTGMAMPLHPGALRYFREAGLISDVPRALVPVDRKAPNRRQEKTGYPDSNVAGSWHESPDGQSTDASAEGVVPIDVHRDIVAPDGRSTSEPSVAPFLWRVVL
jgi:TRAP transporter TAXI family solute receptor